MANTTQSQISNVFNLMVQLDPRLNFYHFGWRSDILRNIDNNFDPGVSKGREFPALHWSVPEFTQYVEAIQYTGLKEDIEMTLYFDDLKDYNNDTSAKVNNLIEQWDALKVIAEDFVANFEKVFCEKYKAGSITLPKFEQFSHGHNDRLITWRVTFTLTHFINCTDAANQIDLNLLPATIEESDLENYKDTGPLPDRCSALLASLTQDDLLNCILPVYDFSDTDTQDATSAQQQTDMINWLCGPVPEVNEFSMSFDGVDEYILTKMALSDYNLERTDTFTFSFWIKPTATQIGAIFSKFLGFTGYTVLYTDMNEIRLNLLNNGAANGIIVKSPVNSLTLNQWQHICITYDGSSSASGVNIYINKVLQTNTVDADTLSASIQNAETLTIGAYIFGGRYYSGLLDEVRAWNIEFNTAQVAVEYNGGSATAEVNEQANNFIALGCGEYSVFGFSNRHFPDRLQTSTLLDGFYASQNMELADMTTDIS